MSPDTLPLWFAIPVSVAAFVAWIVVEVRAANREYYASRAQDPVVVTASGRPSNRFPRSCKTVGGVR